MMLVSKVQHPACHNRTRQSGAALVFVLLLAVISLTVAVSLFRMAQAELRTSNNFVASLQALASAEAGMSHAYQILSTATGGFNPVLNGGGPGGGTGAPMTQLGSGADVNLDAAGTLYRYSGLFPATPIGRGNDGYYVRVEDNFDDTPNNPAVDVDGRVRILSRGRSGNAERIIEALVGKSNSACLFGVSGVTMSGGATLVNSYNPTTLAISNNASVGTNASINLSGGATIQGNASAVGTVSNPSYVTGSVTNGASPQSFPPVAGCSPYSSGAGISFSGSYAYNATTGNLTVSGGSNVSMIAGSYCFNDVVLSGGSTLTVTTSPVTIYITGKGDFSGGSFVNPSHTSASLQLFSSATSTSTQSVTISGGTGTYMTVMAPGVPVTISGASDFFGSAVGNSVTLSGGTLFHCDEGLMSGRLQLLSWHEIIHP